MQMGPNRKPTGIESELDKDERQLEGTLRFSLEIMQVAETRPLNCLERVLRRNQRKHM